MDFSQLLNSAALDSLGSLLDSIFVGEFLMLSLNVKRRIASSLFWKEAESISQPRDVLVPLILYASSIMDFIFRPSAVSMPTSFNFKFASFIEENWYNEEFSCEIKNEKNKRFIKNLDNRKITFVCFQWA